RRLGGLARGSESATRAGQGRKGCVETPGPPIPVPAHAQQRRSAERGPGVGLCPGLDRRVRGGWSAGAVAGHMIQYGDSRVSPARYGPWLWQAVTMLLEQRCSPIWYGLAELPTLTVEQWCSAASYAANSNDHHLLRVLFERSDRSEQDRLGLL